MGNGINYLETFIFPDIPTQLYPVYSVSDKGNVFNLKNIIYPNSRSVKKFTRNKQLKNRSTQAKIFDAFINIGYFSPLITYREFPIIIQKAPPRQEGSCDGGTYISCYLPSRAASRRLIFS